MGFLLDATYQKLFRFRFLENTSGNLPDLSTLYLERLSTTIGDYRVFWWRLSAGWVLSHRFALRSRPALAVLKSDQDQEMGVGLGGHGRGWVRAASAGRQLRRDQS